MDYDDSRLINDDSKGILARLKRLGAEDYDLKEIKEVFSNYKKLKKEANLREYKEAKEDPRLPFTLIFNRPARDIEVSHVSCPHSPIGVCIYLDLNDDFCVYCGDPKERK